MNIEVRNSTNHGYDAASGKPFVIISGVNTILFSFDENESYLYKDEIESVFKILYEKMSELKNKNTKREKYKKKFKQSKNKNANNKNKI